jgi:hypothetical protein
MNRRGFFKFLAGLGLAPLAGKLPVAETVNTFTSAAGGTLNGAATWTGTWVSQELRDDAIIDIPRLFKLNLTQGMYDIVANGYTIPTEAATPLEWTDDLDDDDPDAWEGL